MSKRGDLTRQRILDAALELFSAKGFCGVTMQDIRMACGLSRGGLYRHYSSTEDIFAAIIKNEQEDAFAALEKAKQGGVPGHIMLRTFVRSRMKQLIDPHGSIDNAISEFAKNSAIGRELVTQRAVNSLEILSALIDIGRSEGAFGCEDSRGAALHIMCFFEGAGKHRELLPLSQEDAEKQLTIIGRLLGGDI